MRLYNDCVDYCQENITEFNEIVDVYFLFYRQLFISKGCKLPSKLGLLYFDENIVSFWYERWLLTTDKATSSNLTKFGLNVVLEKYFIDNRLCLRGANYPQSWASGIYFVKHLGNYRRYSFCVNWWNWRFSTTNSIICSIAKN